MLQCQQHRTELSAAMQSWTCCTAHVASLAGPLSDEGKRSMSANLSQRSAMQRCACWQVHPAPCRMLDARCAWQAPLQGAVQGAPDATLMPAMNAMLAYTTLSPIACVAGTRPCCAARSTCSSNHCMHTGCRVSLCSSWPGSALYKQRIHSSASCHATSSLLYLCNCQCCLRWCPLNRRMSLDLIHRETTGAIFQVMHKTQTCYLSLLGLQQGQCLSSTGSCPCCSTTNSDKFTTQALLAC